MDSLLQDEKKDKGASILFWGIMVGGLLLSAGVITYFVLSPAPAVQEVRLENAVREGQPEFDYYKQHLVIAENRDFTQESQNLASGIQMRLVGVARNFTGKTVTGLEVVGSVVNQKGEVIRQKTTIIIPGPQVLRLENNKSTPFFVSIDGFSEKDDRANFSLKMTAVRVE